MSNQEIVKLFGMLLEALLGTLLLLTAMIGVLIYQNARSNRWLKSIDRSLKRASL